MGNPLSLQLATFVVHSFAAPAFAFVAAAQEALPVPATPPAELRVQRWREDLAFLAKELPARHKNLFFQLPREEFEAAVEELDEAVARRSDDELVVEFMRIVASAGDGHTSVQPGRGPVAWTRLPIRLKKFSDGLRVVAIARGREAALGAEVSAVGGVPVDEAWRRVASIVAHENESALAAFAPGDFEVPFLLHGLGLAPDGAHASFRVRDDAGKESELDLDTTPSPNTALGLVTAQTKEKTPLWQSHPDATYWFEWVESSKLLYLQYNACRNDAAKPFAELCSELFAAADAHEVERFVVDVRRNGGGDSTVIAPLFQGLGARRKLRAKGRLFVAIGPATFSSAMMNALQMRAGYGALLVGEPTGGKPNAYGEVKSFELPHSKLLVQYSTQYFEQVPGDPASVEPDVVAPLSWAHWSEGRDPVLEAVLAREPSAK
ncbi:MAG TPA: hypothetical protein VFG37_14735 [Planctomycetota bacterium]|nr:hypothetical protein [Planctomycetota bacterium]